MSHDPSEEGRTTVQETANEAKLDCVIVGAGPAGLTALEYLARFHRSAVALGAAGPRPRLLAIDRTYNLPGYPQGVPGLDLLKRLREQAELMGGEVRNETAKKVTGSDGDFTVTLSDGTALRARKIILAMGVVDRNPDIPNIQGHIGRFVRYCPVCDGYEHTGKRLGILGSGGSVARHALFLQTFSNDITIFLDGASRDTLGRYQKVLREKNIYAYEPRVVKIIECDEQQRSAIADASDSDYNGCGVCLEDGSEHALSVLYSALGCDLQLDCVREFPLDLDEDGYIRVDINQATNIPGLYAAGDLVSQISQISVAFGQAAVAAVRIHNALDDEE